MEDKNVTNGQIMQHLYDQQSSIKDLNVTNRQIMVLIEEMNGKIQLLAEVQQTSTESLRSEIHGVRTELREFKDEMYAFRAEANGKFDDLYKLHYDFRDEMYSFRDEMYSFRDDTQENFKTLFEYSGNVAHDTEHITQTTADHEQRITALESTVLRGAKA